MQRRFRLTMQETINLAAKALLEKEGLKGNFDVGSMHSVELDVKALKAEVAFVEISVTDMESSDAG